MKKETKKYLRERWNSQEFISTFPIAVDYKMNVELLNGVDFRGIPKIRCGEPFYRFPSLHSSQLKNIDFSFGDGSISLSHSQVENLSFINFKFDKSSIILKSIIKNSTFLNAKLTLDVTDTTFENCDFTSSKFNGGFREYGFIRCKFINCNFSSAFWKNTYILAGWFIDCNFKDFKISKSSIGGFKVNILNEKVKAIFEDCEVQGIKEITNKI